MVTKSTQRRDDRERARLKPSSTGEAGETSGSDAYYFVVVTYMRPTGFADILQSVLAQTLPPKRVIVVDNSPDVTNWEPTRTTSSVPIDYLPQSENVGFAGGLAAAIDRVLETAGPDEWVMICPDDMPLTTTDFAARSVRAANSVLALDPYTAAVGRFGATIDLSAGKLQKWRKRHPGTWEPGIQPVDYVATGPGPLFRVRGFQEAGGFRAELFVGMTEVEMGVRLRRAGFSLYVLRGLPPLRASREAWAEGPERMGSPWREYYSVRNFLTVMREHSTWINALRFSFLHGTARPIVQFVSKPSRRAGRRMLMSLRGVRDGWRGRLGRTIKPESGVEPASVTAKPTAAPGPTGR